MRRTARKLSGELRGKLDGGDRHGLAAVVGIAFLAVVREGLETTLLFFASAQGATIDAAPLVGLAAGLLTSVRARRRALRRRRPDQPDQVLHRQRRAADLRRRRASSSTASTTSRRPACCPGWPRTPSTPPAGSTRRPGTARRSPGLFNITAQPERARDGRLRASTSSRCWRSSSPRPARPEGAASPDVAVDSTPPIPTSPEMPVRDRAVPARSLPVTRARLTAAACGRGRRRRRRPPTTSRSTATDNACDVATTSSPAGTHRFTVTNEGTRSPSSTSTPTATGSSARSRTSPPAWPRSCSSTSRPATYEAACKPGMVGDGIRHELTVTGTSRRRSRRRGAAGGRSRTTRPTCGRRSPTCSEQTAQFAAAITAEDVAKAQGALPGRPAPLRADRAGRGELRRPRPEDRRPRERRRARAGPGPASTCSRRRSGPAATSRGGPVADQLNTDVADLASPRDEARPRSRWTSPTARSACSTRSRPARSPARRTATRTPTSTTSRPTSRAPSRRSGRCAR